MTIEGHGIEARIYAENPDNQFLLSIGMLLYLRLPEYAAFTNAPVRVDGGMQTGDAITPHYDPMIAKLIVHGHDRDDARSKMLAALEQTQMGGVDTNLAAAAAAKLLRSHHDGRSAVRGRRRPAGA